MSDSAIVSFMRGSGSDHAGRTIAEIWGWDHRRLEMVHDYIQWLFPSREPSRFNPDAPLLTRVDCETIRADPALQANMGRSLDLMLDFFGLKPEDGAIVRAADFTARSADWLAPANHNHLRMTRIMISLGLVGRAADARALYTCLSKIADREGRGVISDRTLGFWEEAAGRSGDILRRVRQL